MVPSSYIRRIRNFLQKTEAQIVLTSFMILFLELLLIRWLGANILNLAYFSNLVLMASFFGIGIGCLMAGRGNLFKYFPHSLLLVVMIVGFRFGVHFFSPEALYFTNWKSQMALPFWVITVPLFALTALTFIGPAQRLGCLFQKIAPLKAYAWDIIGSLAGIILFSVISYLGANPLYWFAVVILAYYLLNLDQKKARLWISTSFFVVIFALLSLMTTNTYWSPYYKIVVKPIGNIYPPIGYELFANETGHQSMVWPQLKEWIYFTPYGYFQHPTYSDVLIIGAGSGTDAALALEKGAQRIDAVDIDPVIVDLGRKLNPARPYDDSRVHITIADGRNFLETTDRKYDLIIFALTDSLALASSYSNTRLESYLFTEESFALAKQRLNDDGLLVLYNYYREPWLVEKISGMLVSVFGTEPYVIKPEARGQLASIMIGPKLQDLRADIPPSYRSTQEYRPATDAWPFLYLKKPGIPMTYVIALAILLLITFLTVAVLSPVSLRRRAFSWHFFFLGSGFLLLETKNVINFQLLFGSTWLVNSLVFVAILLMVLAAVLITQRGLKVKQRHLYAALAFVLLLNLIIPLRILAPLPTVLRYVLAAILTLSPIFFANLIFTDSFKSAARPELSFGANLLGSMVGGFAEYFAMAIGYHYLVVVALVFYGASWLTRLRPPGD